MDGEEPDRIMIENETAVLYWTYRFDVGRDELCEAVDAVGDSPAAVAAYLNVDLGREPG